MRAGDEGQYFDILSFVLAMALATYFYSPIWLDRNGIALVGLVCTASARQNKPLIMEEFMQSNGLAVSMKLGMRRLASGVCVLSTILPDNQRFAMTVSSVTSVSDSPASLLVCINQLVSQQGHLATLGTRFAVNVLSVAHQDVSNTCAGREVNKNRFTVGNWVQDDTGLPILADAQAVFVCEADQVTTYGTHKIVIGVIHNVILPSTGFDPLLYADASYGAFSRL